MLLQLDRICRQLKISYFLDGGTMLGAVRHKGFIPWDDDIDVSMLREDYEVFKRKAGELLPEPFFLQTYESDPFMPFNFAKIRNSQTTFIESAVRKIQMNHGVYIDVFPVDYYPDDPSQARKMERILKFLDFGISQVFTVDKKPALTGKDMLEERVARAVCRDIPKAIRRRDQVYQSVKKSTLRRSFPGAWGMKEIVPAEWLEELIPWEFEGHVFPVPAEYDKYLTHYYGDYMTPPPKENQISHHDTEIIDLERPYTEYMKDGEIG